jgi:hypothetical protein
VVHPLPTVDIQLGSQLGTLEATSGFLSYTWFLDGVELSGQTNSTLTALVNGVYLVEVTDDNGCSSTATFVYNSAGLAFEQLEFTVYPNPTSGEVFLTTNGIQFEGILVVDALGREVFNETIFHEGVFKIDLSHLESGVYNLHLVSSIGLANKRLIKK